MLTNKFYQFLFFCNVRISIDTVNPCPSRSVCNHWCDPIYVTNTQMLHTNHSRPSCLHGKCLCTFVSMPFSIKLNANTPTTKKQRKNLVTANIVENINNNAPYSVACVVREHRVCLCLLLFYRLFLLLLFLLLF